MAESTDHRSEKPQDAKEAYALIYSAGPSWIAGKTIRDQPYQPHAEYLTQLHRDHRLAFAGLFPDGEFKGLALVHADSEDQAKAMLARDPAIQSGLFLGEIRRWYTAIDGTRTTLPDRQS